MTKLPASLPPLSWGGHARAILGLGLPLMGSHLAQFAIGLTDTVMVGWYGVEELAALVLGSAYFFTLFLMGSGFAWAVMPMVASAAGTGDETQVRRVTRMGLWISAIFACAALPLMVWSGPILRLLGQDPKLAAMAADYLQVAGFGLLPALLVMVFKSYLAALERTQIVLWITLGMALLNVPVNYALIFGNWGAPELGVRGAALASVVTQIFALAACIAYAAVVTRRYTLFARLWRPDMRAFAEVFRLGWPIGLTNLAEVGLFAASSFMVGWVGTAELAAHGIALNVASLTFMIQMGLSNAATIRAGQAFGRHDEELLRQSGVTAIGLSLGFAAATMVLFLTFPELLIGLFLDPAEPARVAIIAVGTTLLAMAAFFQLADGAQVMALGLLRGVQDTRIPMIIAAFSYWAVGMPLGYWLAFPLGWAEVGVWAGLVAGLMLAAGLLMARFWARSVRIARPDLSSASATTPSPPA